jgi:hypothetical protein
MDSKNPPTEILTVQLNLFERIILIFLLVLACLPIVTIPLVIRVFYQPKWTRRFGGWTMIILLLFVLTGLMFSLIQGSYFLPELNDRYWEHNLFPVSVWEKILARDWDMYYLMIADGLMMFALYWIFEILLEMRNRQSSRPDLNGWAKWRNVFRWKSVENGVNSGELTLYRLKMATYWSFLIVAIIGATANLILWDFNIPEIVDAINTDIFERTTEEYIALGAWVGLGGLGYIISHGMVWFLLGRLITNYANFTLRRYSDKRWGTTIRIVVRLLGWGLVLSLLAPFIGSIITPDFSWGFWIAGAFQVLGLLMIGDIIYHVSNGPDKIYMDPHAYRQDYHPLSSQIRVQRWGLWVVIMGTIGIATINGIIWFSAVGLYQPTSPWYEWGFYLFLGFIITLGPVVALFFLNSTYTRRSLMIYYIVTILLLLPLVFRISPFDFDFNYFMLSFIFQLRVGRTKFYDYIDSSAYPWQIILIFASVVCSVIIFIVLRNHALPIANHTRTWEKFPLWQNMKWKLSHGLETKEIIGGVFLILLLSGLNTTLLQEDRVITLTRPEGHEMRVSFWASGFNLPNHTLSELGTYNIRLFVWSNAYDIAGAQRYASFGVQMARVISFQDDPTKWDKNYEDATENMDFWDANGLQHKPWLGFVFDIEKWKLIPSYNESNYRMILEHMNNFTAYVGSRNYSVFFTNYLMNIGDLYDGDEHVSILNMDPANYTLTTGLGHYDWMIYRAETAISYSEPHEYFTYQYGTQIKNYMLHLGGEELFKKASMSLGVTSSEMPLYVGEKGFQEFMQDVKIAHALEFSNIIIFVLGRPQTEDGFFEWGNDSISRMMEELNTYESVEFHYKRRASFLGNLKMEQNPTGSYFGFLYQDCWLNENVGFFTPWILGLIIIVPFGAYLAPVKKLQGSKEVNPPNTLHRGGKWIALICYAEISLALGLGAYIMLWELI